LAYVMERNSNKFEVLTGAFRSGEGDHAINHPPEWLAASTEEERADLRIHDVPPAEVPDGMIVVSRHYDRVDGVVTEILELAPAPIVVPASVTPRQLRLALLGAGKLAQVTAFVGSGQAPEAAVISWEYATEFLRSDPMLNQLAGALQPPMTAEQIDQLFVAAAQIQ